jgi:leucyl aminopeptidase (aminopeptidase T)
MSDCKHEWHDVSGDRELLALMPNVHTAETCTTCSSLRVNGVIVIDSSSLAAIREQST